MIVSNAEDRQSSVNKDTCPSSRPKRSSFAVLEVMSLQRINNSSLHISRKLARQYVNIY